MDIDTSNALKQALTAMSHQELLNLMIQLSNEQADFRRILLANVTISPQILKQQLRDSQAVTQFKRAISKFFNDLEDRAGYYEDYYDQEYDEGEEYPELDTVLKNAKVLHPADQMEVFWHILTCSEKIFEQEEFFIGTPPIEEAIQLYAQAVNQLELPQEGKQLYFDKLLDVFSWDMCHYGEISDTLEKALGTLCQIPEDYHYIIDKLTISEYERSADLIAEYYLKLGDDNNYLKVRYANLETEDQYLELAHYWQQQGKSEKYLKTLEQWVSDLAQQHDSADSQSASFELSHFSPVESSPILQTLAEHYRQQQDDENLCRILMTMAEYEEVTLELYKQVKKVATRLNRWEVLQPKLIDFGQRDYEQLAEIYLYEKQWDAAIELAHQNSNSYYDEPLNILVAEGVKEHRTEMAIQLYQQLVQSHIEGKNREHYRIAARHANALKSIYLSILNDLSGWQHYITGLRQRYPRHRALQEELKPL